MFSKKKPQFISFPEKITPLWIQQNITELKKSILAGSLVIDSGNKQYYSNTDKALLKDLRDFAEKSRKIIHFHNLPQEITEATKPQAKAKVSRPPYFPGLFLRLGEFVLLLYTEIQGHLVLLSEALYGSTLGFFKPKTTFPGSWWQQVSQLGYQALPIVLLLSFLIGLTLAIQSAVQLEKFGASMYLASGIGISMVTEIGPLITAVILSCRSGSAINAEIASMTVNEEVKALKTMDIQILDFLLLPRFWAMTVMVPLLTICANLIGIFAGFIISTFYAGIAPTLFVNELLGAVTLTMVFQSLLKTVVFAWIIALIAVYRGLHVQGGASAVGRATTACVVSSIFTIILADAIFSFIFYV